MLTVVGSIALKYFGVAYLLNLKCYATYIYVTFDEFVI